MVNARLCEKVRLKGLVQMLLHSCAEPNLIKFDFRATLERWLFQTSYLRRTQFEKPVVKIFDEKICVLNSRTLSK